VLLGWVSVGAQDACCNAPVNIGFSSILLRGTAPFEGVEGVGPLCAARDGVIEHDLASGPQKVYLNIVSQLDALDLGVQGWSLNIRLDGGGDILSATTTGTTADRKEDGGFWSGGFNRTTVLDPRHFQELKAAMSSVVLSLTEGTTLPLEGTESILALEVNGAEGAISVLSGVEGIRGFETPVVNIVTVGGDSRNPCNKGTARIEIRHVVDDFIRGNANGDERLDIADAVWILNELFHDGRPSPCGDAADSNDDGRIDISDAVHLIRYLFLTGSAPSWPFPECGLDETEDDLDCPGGSLPC